MVRLPHRASALCASLSLVAAVAAQETIYASFVLTRTGERTPLADRRRDIIQLTALGANSVYQVGSDLRNRYINANGSSSTTIQGLAANTIPPDQLFILAPDRQYTAASAQAFLQAFYPPTAINDTASQDLGALANGSTVFNPLDGYQYGWVHAASNNDPESIFVSATSRCSTWQDNVDAWLGSSSFTSTQATFQDLYARAGDVLGDEVLGKEDYDYANAYYIADYLSYMNVHNSTFHGLLTDGLRLRVDHFPQMLGLASQAQWARYGAGYSEGNMTIALVAGQSLASAIIDSLTTNIVSEGESNKLTLLFTDYPPFLSFSALAQLPENAPAGGVDFTAMPDFASQLVFELFTNSTSGSNDSSTLYPSPADLRVRLLFRNGSDTSTSLTSYHMFGSSELSMAWYDFQASLSGVSLEGTTPLDSSDGPWTAWCANCNAWLNTPFCLSTDSDAVDAALGSPSSTAAHHRRSGMSNALAGAIGAVATLCLVGLIMFLGVGCLGWRVTRKPYGNSPSTASAATAGPGPTSPRRTTSGGFKGGMKLESDVDLPSGVAATNNTGKEDNHGRVSSWEMKSAPPISPLTPSQSQGVWQGRSRDDDELSERVNPFADPVRPRENI